MFIQHTQWVPYETRLRMGWICPQIFRDNKMPWSSQNNGNSGSFSVTTSDWSQEKNQFFMGIQQSSFSDTTLFFPSPVLFLYKFPKRTLIFFLSSLFFFCTNPSSNIASSSLFFYIFLTAEPPKHYLYLYEACIFR